MSLVKPNKQIALDNKGLDKKLLDASLAFVGMEQISDLNGNSMSYAEAVAKRIWSIALAAEKDKDCITAAKFISERIHGKPAVLNEEEKEEIPEIVFRVNTKDAERVKELAKQDLIQDEPEDPLIVEIDGEPTREF